MMNRAEVLDLARETLAKEWPHPWPTEPVLARAVIEMAAELERGKNMFVKELAPRQMELERRVAQARGLLQDATVEVTPELTPYDQWHEEVARFLEATKK